MDPQDTLFCVSSVHLLVFVDRPATAEFTDHPVGFRGAWCSTVWVPHDLFSCPPDRMFGRWAVSGFRSPRPGCTGVSVRPPRHACLLQRGGPPTGQACPAVLGLPVAFNLSLFPRLFERLSCSALEREALPIPWLLPRFRAQMGNAVEGEKRDRWAGPCHFHPDRRRPAGATLHCLVLDGFLFLQMWSFSAVEPHLKALLLVLDPGTLRSWQRGLEGEALPGAGYGGTFGGSSRHPLSLGGPIRGL